MDEGLGDRLFNFAVKTIELLGTFNNSPEAKVVRFQLAKASTSSGANYEEAQSASSGADFRNKMKISLREMREANYWLRISHHVKFGNMELTYSLVNESGELKKILGSIAVNSKKIFNF